MLNSERKPTDYSVAVDHIRFLWSKGFMSAPATTLRQDVKVMGLVGAAHWASHFFQLVLPALFLFLRDEFQVSFAALGLLTTLLYGASGLAQTPAGFLVDRFGARTVLLSGLTLASLATLAVGLVQNYWLLMPLAVLAGLGNSVFHPADLAILTSITTFSICIREPHFI